MNFRKCTSQLLIVLFLTIGGYKTMAQQPGSFMIPDLDGYKRAYKLNYSGAQGYKEFFKTYKDSYLDTAYYISNSLKALDKSNAGWRLTNQVGPTFPYCGKLASDQNLFLKGGAYNNLEVDRLLGKKGTFGLGLLGGYAFYGVDQDAYKARYDSYFTQISKVPTSNTTLLKSKPYEIFYLLAGPVATFNLGQKLGLDLSVKAGPAHNDVARVGATNTLTQEIIHREQPTEKRWSIGGNIGARLMYKIAEKWKIGLNANAFNSNTEYETIDPVAVGNNYKLQSRLWDRKQSNFNFGAAIQRIWPTEKRPVYIPLARLDPPVAAPVAVAPSIINPGGQTFVGNEFNNSFSWKSNDNQADKANEMFNFKLYKVPGKEPIVVKTTKDSNLTLENGLVPPSGDCDTDEYYYTVHSTKGASFSEMVTSSFKLANANAAGCVSKAVAGEKDVTPKNVYLTRILGNEKFTRQIIKYDEGKGCKCPIDTLSTSGNRLIEYYRQYTANTELGTWPDGLPIPKKASGFTYEVRKVFDGSDEKPDSVERYRMDVDRKTREVTLTPIAAPKRKKGSK